MPISQFLSDKWDERLHNWLLWISSGGGDGKGGGAVGISSIYRPELSQRGTERTQGRNAVLSGPALDTDKLMVALQSRGDDGRRLYACLVEWTVNDGTRGQQAHRRGVHPDTYKDIVDSGKRELERMDREKSTRQSNKSKSTRLSPERA